MEPQLFSCGLLVAPAAMSTDPWRPSMEPQLFSCGLQICVITRWCWNTLQWSRNFSVADCRYVSSPGDAGIPFNGAATFQLRIDVVIQGDSLDVLTFNGAATFQLRIVANSDHSEVQCSFLQWSRNFSVADCSKMNIVRSKIGIPSMEPQLFSCGLLCNRDCITLKILPFNGAATFQLRIVVKIWTDCIMPMPPSMEPQLFSCGLLCVVSTVKPRDSPSMEPQLFSCGLLAMDNAIPCMCSLQWSRNFSVADCANQKGQCQVLQKPLQWSRNFSVADCAALFNMENSYTNLQWSRNFSVADWMSVGVSIPRSSNLQWSRNFSVADWMSKVAVNQFFMTFNGAATFQLRIVGMQGSGKTTLVPSMEPQLFSCGLLQSPKRQV